MWPLSIVFILSFSMINGETTVTFFCDSVEIQEHIDVQQLMGMWFGIEIYGHDTDRFVKSVSTCPIIHVSEDKEYSTTTYNPLYKDYKYDYNYGEKHTSTPNPFRGNKNIYKNKNRYEELGWKWLRLWWDEDFSPTEYHLRYRDDKLGFWYSSGPNNEVPLQYRHFAGTIQVLKAVGNHMVLTFCHQLPHNQLFTILLAREQKLDNDTIYGVRKMLNRRGLRVNSIKKVCGNGSTKLIYNSMNLSIIFTIIMYFSR